MKRIIGIIVSIGIFFGIEYYIEQSTYKEMKSELNNICTTDKVCLDSVSQFMDVCFKKHYSMGSKHKSGDLNIGLFIKCINQNAQEEIFTYNEEKSK